MNIAMSSHFFLKHEDSKQEKHETESVLPEGIIAISHISFTKL